MHAGSPFVCGILRENLTQITKELDRREAHRFHH